MYCPYCDCEAPRCVKPIADTDGPQTQILPACCFQHVQIEERNVHVLTREEMLDLLSPKFSVDSLSKLTDQQIYWICEGAGLVRRPERVGGNGWLG